MSATASCEMEIRGGEYFCKLHDVPLKERDAAGLDRAGRPGRMRAFICPVSKMELEAFPKFSN